MLPFLDARSRVSVGFGRMGARLRTAVVAVRARPTPGATAVERIKALGRAYVLTARAAR